MPNRICFASIDVEQDVGGNSFYGVEDLDKILSIFKKNNIPATLFVTGEVLQKYPVKFQKLAASYEIAGHSFTHRFWNTLDSQAREKELDDFIDLYQRIFQSKPLGFRAPSHVIDEDGIQLLDKKGFLYDSSVVPHYPPFKKYRGYKGKRPLTPYFPEGREILEIPVSGQLLGIPLAGAWMAKLPYLLYKILFFFHCPKFITLNIHSWDTFSNLEKIIKILKDKNYQFLNGAEVFRQNRK